MPPLDISQDGDDVLIRVKAVPGSSRDQIAGLVGDRLKIRISAPPEAGKANKAICKLLARHLGVKPKDVTIETGQTNPEKAIRIAGANADRLREQLAEE